MENHAQDAIGTSGKTRRAMLAAVAGGLAAATATAGGIAAAARTDGDISEIGRLWRRHEELTAQDADLDRKLADISREVTNQMPRVPDLLRRQAGRLHGLNSYLRWCEEDGKRVYYIGPEEARSLRSRLAAHRAGNSYGPAFAACSLSLDEVDEMIALAEAHIRDCQALLAWRDEHPLVDQKQQCLDEKWDLEDAILEAPPRDLADIACKIRAAMARLSWVNDLDCLRDIAAQIDDFAKG